MHLQKLSTSSFVLQGLEPVIVEPHFEGQRRISVAVVEGSEGPIALLPSQEEVISPEADFLDADIEAERKLAQAEVQHMRPSVRLIHTCCERWCNRERCIVQSRKHFFKAGILE